MNESITRDECPKWLFFIKFALAALFPAIRRYGRSRRHNFGQFASLLFVNLRTDCTGYLESVLREKVSRDSAPAGMVRNGNDLPVLRNPRQAFFKVRRLDAEVHREAAVRGYFVRPANIDD